MIEYESKTEEINRIIEKLYMVSSEADCEEICQKFDEVYLDCNGELNPMFRHEYSNISGKIRELNEIEIDGEKVYSLEYLLDNINNVYEYAKKLNKPYINNLFKLKDHIGLESGRILLVQQLEWKISNGQESVKNQLEQMQYFATAIGEQLQKSTALMGELKESEQQIQKSIEKTEKSLNDINDLANETSRKIKDVEKEYVAILGIFAAIVLSFTGGFAFTSSVLENFQSGTIYRWLTVILLVGLVLINILYALFNYMDRLIHDTTSKRIRPLWPINIALTILIIGVWICWGFGLVEKIQKNNVSVFYEDGHEINDEDIGNTND